MRPFQRLLVRSRQRRELPFGLAASLAPRRCLSAALAGDGLSLRAFREAYEPSPGAPAGEFFSGLDRASAAPAAASTTSPAGELSCVVRGRVVRTRGHGKLAFLLLRQPPFESVQVVCVGKQLAAQARAVTPESVIEVSGVMRRGQAVPIQSASCAHHELHASSIRVLSAAAAPLPFPLQDGKTHLETRLNYRYMDMRTPLTGAVLRLVSAVGQSFRRALLELDFVEIHTPKLLAAPSEGGSAVFEVAYFSHTKAYLAQSPQLYKQMALNGDAMRVFEVGPVFRAEQSLTHRHLTEFTGLDAEMVIGESYTEVLDVLEYVMCRVLDDLADARKPFASLVHIATSALRESASTTAASETPESVTTRAGAEEDTGAQSPNTQDIVCEVSEETTRTYGLVSDSTGTTVSAAAADKYNARLGGGAPLPRGVVAAAVEGAGPQTLRCPRVLRMRFDDAVRLLLDANDISAEESAAMEDFSLPLERRLGQRIKQRYGVDLYVVDCWPVGARPFYTMPCGADELLPAGTARPSGEQTGATRTRSYDMYLRGEEICSGAQRQHDATKLVAAMAARGMDAGTRSAGLKDYVDSFRYGAWPHGGFGLGLERIVAFFLGARDIRQASLFPRDPKRLTP